MKIFWGMSDNSMNNSKSEDHRVIKVVMVIIMGEVEVIEEFMVDMVVDTEALNLQRHNLP